MVKFAILFLIIAIVSGIFGFMGFSSSVAWLGQIVFYISLTFFFLALAITLFLPPKN